MLEHLVNHLQGFHVVLIYCHFEVKTRKLAQMPARVRILGSKDRADFEHSIEITRYGHLLVQLRRLGQARSRSKVVGCEDSSPTFAFASNKLGRMDFNEPLRVQ